MSRVLLPGDEVRHRRLDLELEVFKGGGGALDETLVLGRPGAVLLRVGTEDSRQLE